MANYPPPNAHYMQQQQQQQMNQQRQQAIYMQQHAMHHQIPDGSVRQGIPQHMIPTMMPGQRPPHMPPQQRLMMMSSQPLSQNQMQNLQHQQQQQLQSRPMGMNPPRQMMQQIPTSQPMQQQQQQPPPQHYLPQFNPQQQPPQRGIAPSPSSSAKGPPQQVHIRPDGMRSQLQMGQPMIIRNPGDPMSSQSMIIQQPSHISTSNASPAYIRNVQPSSSQPQPIQVRPHSQGQYIRPAGLIQRRPDQDMHPGAQYVIRGPPPPGYTAIAIAPTSGEQQYQIVQQPNFVQTSGQMMRPIRPIATSQQPSQLRMALGNPSQQGMVMQVVHLPPGAAPPDGATPMIIDQSGGMIATSSAAIPPATTTVTMKPPPSATRPPAPAPVATIPAAKPTSSRPPAKKPSKSAKAKAGAASQAAAQPVAKKPEPAASLLTPQSRLIDNLNFDEMLAHIGVKDNLESSVKNAMTEFAETYAEYLVSELIESARLRKVNKIENRDAKFVILREQNKDKDSDGKKK